MERDRKKSKAVLGSPECHEALSEGPEEEENELDDHEMSEQEAHVLACLGQLSVAGLLGTRGGLDGSELHRAGSAPDGQRRKVRGSRALSASYHSRLRSCMLNEKGSPLAHGSKSYTAVADAGQENAPPVLFALAEHSKCWLGGRRPSPRTMVAGTTITATTTTGVLGTLQLPPRQSPSGSEASSPSSHGPQPEQVEREAEAQDPSLVVRAVAAAATGPSSLFDQTAGLPEPPRRGPCESPAPPKPRTHRRSHSGTNCVEVPGCSLADSAETLHGPHDNDRRAGSQPLLSEAAMAATATWKQHLEGGSCDDREEEDAATGGLVPSCRALSDDQILQGGDPRAGTSNDGVGTVLDTSQPAQPVVGAAAAPVVPTPSVSKYGIAAFAVPASVHSCFAGPMTASSMQQGTAEAPGTTVNLHSAAAGVINPFALVQAGSAGANVGSGSGWPSLSGSGSGAQVVPGAALAAGAGLLGPVASAPVAAARMLGGSAGAPGRYAHSGSGAGAGNALADSAEELELRRLTQQQQPGPNARDWQQAPPQLAPRQASNGPAPANALGGSAATAAAAAAAPALSGVAAPAFVPFDLASLARSAGAILAGSASLPCGSGAAGFGPSGPLALLPLHLSNSTKSQPNLQAIFTGRAGNNSDTNQLLPCNHTFIPCRSSNNDQPRAEPLVGGSALAGVMMRADRQPDVGQMEHDDDDSAVPGSDRYGGMAAAGGARRKALHGTNVQRGGAERNLDLTKTTGADAVAGSETRGGVDTRRAQEGGCARMPGEGGRDVDVDGDGGCDDEGDEDGTPWLRTSQQAPDPDDPSSAGKYSAVLLRRLQAAAAHEELYGVAGAGHTGLYYLQASFSSVQSLADCGGRRLGSGNHSSSSVEPSPMPRLSYRMRRLRASPCGGGSSSGGGSAGPLTSPAPSHLGTRSRSAGVTPGTDRRLRRRSELLPDLFGGRASARRRGELGEDDDDGGCDIGEYADCCPRDGDVDAAAGGEDHLMSDAAAHDQQCGHPHPHHRRGANGGGVGRQVEELLGAGAARCRKAQQPPPSTSSWLLAADGASGGPLHHSISQPGLVPSDVRRWHSAAVLPNSARDAPLGNCARAQPPTGVVQQQAATAAAQVPGGRCGDVGGPSPGSRSEPLVLQHPRGLLPHAGEGFLSGLMDYDDEGVEYTTPPHTPLRGVGGGSHGRDPATAPLSRGLPGLESALPPSRSSGREGGGVARGLFEGFPAQRGAELAGGRGGAQFRVTFAGGQQQRRQEACDAHPTPAGLLAGGRPDHCAASSQQWLVAEALDSTQGFNKFIALAANNNDRGGAERLWQEMCSRGVSPDVNTLNALLRCLARSAADPDDAQRLVVDVCSRGGFSTNGTSQRLLEEICFRFEQLNCSGLEG